MIATDIDVEKLTAIAQHDNIVAERLDVLNAADTTALAARHPAPDALFNCAGYVQAGTILDRDEAAFSFSVDLNVRAMYRMSRRSSRACSRSAGGQSLTWPASPRL